MLSFRLARKTQITALIIGLLGLIILAGCSSTATAGEGTPAASATATDISTSVAAANNNVYSVAVFFQGKQVAALTRDDLVKLNQVSITASGSPQNGPTLLSALQKAGINDFSELTAFGMTRGRIATAELILKKDQVDDSVVLDMNNRGKCKLCGINIPQNNWIIDLEKLEVK